MEQLLQKFEEHLTAQGKAPSTVKHALIHVRGFLYQSNVTDLSQVNTQMITDYLTKLEGRSQARETRLFGPYECFSDGPMFLALDSPGKSGQ